MSDIPVITEAGSVTIPVAKKDEPPAPKTYTAEELAAATAEARKKAEESFQAALAETNSQIATLRASQEERDKVEKARVAEEAAAAEAQRQAEEENMATRELLERREEEFTQQLNETKLQFEVRMRALEEDNARKDALLDQERRYQDLQIYRTRRIEETQDDIMPELRDLVTGDDEEAIERSLADLKGRTDRIVADVAATQQQQRQGARGVGLTNPPIGPMENEDGQRTFTMEDIRAMSPSEYAQHREALMRAASATRR